jgi:ribose 5-phosphate isomerase RpiB
MKRVLCGALLAAAAFAVPAHAAQDPGISVTPHADETGVGVSTTVNHQPGVAAYYHTSTNTFCAGMSYQIPFCVTVPIQVG